MPNEIVVVYDLAAPVDGVSFVCGFYTVQHGNWSEVVSKEVWLAELTKLEQEEQQTRVNASGG